jgi:hypothetical protein
MNRRVTITWQLAQQPGAGSALRDALRDTAAVVGKSILLPNVLFYGDMHRSLPVSIPTLQELFAIMKEHPGSQPQDLSAGAGPGANDEEPQGRDQDIRVVV